MHTVCCMLAAGGTTIVPLYVALVDDLSKLCTILSTKYNASVLTKLGGMLLYAGEVVNHAKLTVQSCCWASMLTLQACRHTQAALSTTDTCTHADAVKHADCAPRHLSLS